MAKAAASEKAMSKSEVLASLAESTGLTKKQVGAVVEGLGELMVKSLGKKGPGKFVVPGLMRVKVVRKPATKARKGINPFTGEETMFKAKPARNVVKISPLKGLKDRV
ncbi:MAG: HU family DNA-binding protein [Pirellulales bacterium]|nr:HU family DNA-binding protein [Pirellulales bacterium]